MSGLRVPEHLGLFGKLPQRGDFQRAHLREPEGRAFETWLAENVERAHGAIPRGPLRFALSMGNPTRTLVGSMLPRHDAVGRAFPIGAFLTLPQELDATIPRSVLLPFCGAACEQLELYLEALRTGSDASVEAPTAPHESELPAAMHEAAQTLSGEDLESFALRALKGPALEHLPYALETIRRACEMLQDEITLDLPVEEDFDLFVWLELLGARGARPSVMWSPETERALASLRRPTTQCFLALTKPQVQDLRLWPVTTPQDASRSVAQAELPLSLNEAIARDTTLDELVSAFRTWP